MKKQQLKLWQLVTTDDIDYRYFEVIADQIKKGITLGKIDNFCWIFVYTDNITTDDVQKITAKISEGELKGKLGRTA